MFKGLIFKDKLSIIFFFYCREILVITGSGSLLPLFYEFGVVHTGLPDESPLARPGPSLVNLSVFLNRIFENDLFSELLPRPKNCEHYQYQKFQDIIINFTMLYH